MIFETRPWSFLADASQPETFTTEDLHQYKTWREAVNAGIYMSRWFPMKLNGRSVDENPHFRWFVIVFNGKDAGTVWLEREESDNDVVRLGILIGQEDLLGKGIGREAIHQAILAAQSDFHFKTVRLNVRKNTRERLPAIWHVVSEPLIRVPRSMIRARVSCT